MFPFSDKTYKALNNAGWHPGRDYDIELFKNIILNSGYKMFPKVEQFLRSYGALRINYKLRNDTQDVLHFNVEKAIGDVDPLWAQTDYFSRLGKIELCVVGQAYTNHLTLMMDEYGRFYGGFDDFLCFIASSGEEAIEAICSDVKCKEIQ